MFTRQQLNYKNSDITVLSILINFRVTVYLDNKKFISHILNTQRGIDFLFILQYKSRNYKLYVVILYVRNDKYQEFLDIYQEIA